MIARLRQWLERKLLDRAQERIERYGLSVVKIETVAGTTYIQHADGELLKIVSVPRAKKGTAT